MNLLSSFDSHGLPIRVFPVQFLSRHPCCKSKRVLLPDRENQQYTVTASLKERSKLLFPRFSVNPLPIRPMSRHSYHPHFATAPQLKPSASTSTASDLASSSLRPTTPTSRSTRIGHAGLLLRLDGAGPSHSRSRSTGAPRPSRRLSPCRGRPKRTFAESSLGTVQTAVTLRSERNEGTFGRGGAAAAQAAPHRGPWRWAGPRNKHRCTNPPARMPTHAHA